MRFRFDMPGETYSKNKESFKRILARHGLRWRGSLDRPFWASGTERVDRGRREALEAAAAGATPRADGTGDRLDRDLRMDFEGIVTVETVTLAAVIGQDDDSHVTLPTSPFAVAAVGKSAHIRMDLP